MKPVLVVGGSGYVGSLTLPYLKDEFSLRVFDLRPPADPSLEFVEGTVQDRAALLGAAQGCGALLYMAMGWSDNSEAAVTSAFDVNVKGVYLALWAAHDAGIAQAVYTSSMSVYANLYHRHFPDEDLPPDETVWYGFTKRLGEEACRNAARAWGMQVNALRLCHPVADTEWAARCRPGYPPIHTAASDVAAAFRAALRLSAGFQAFMVSGDYEQKVMNQSKAKRMLGWEPKMRPPA